MAPALVRRGPPYILAVSISVVTAVIVERRRVITVMVPIIVPVRFRWPPLSTGDRLELDPKAKV